MGWRNPRYAVRFSQAETALDSSHRGRIYGLLGIRWGPLSLHKDSSVKTIDKKTTGKTVERLIRANPGKSETMDLAGANFRA